MLTHFAGKGDAHMSQLLQQKQAERDIDSHGDNTNDNGCNRIFPRKETRRTDFGKNVSWQTA